MISTIKKFSLAVFLTVFGVFTANAQKIEKSTKLMGGTMELRGILPDDGPNKFEIDFNPVVGIFVADNLVVGPGLNLAYAKTSGTDTKSFKFGISPLVRKYFGEGKMKPYGVGTIGYNWTDTDSPTQSSNESFFSAGIGAGVAMFPVPAVGMDMSLNYLVNPRFNDGVNAIMFRVAFFVYKRPMKKASK